MTAPVYALNLFDVADRDEYLAYSRRSAQDDSRRKRIRIPAHPAVEKIGCGVRLPQKAHAGCCTYEL